MKLQVSVITPTYNRTEHIRNAIAAYKAQTFPKDQMEWIILDDGDEPVEAILMDEAWDLPNIRYIREYRQLPLGEKRNRLNKEARAPIIVAWDDDDYYVPERIEYIVSLFKANPKVEVVGSSLMYFYFKDDQSIWSLGPFGPFHSTNGPLAYRATYAKTHAYEAKALKTEEPYFLNNFTEPLIQMDPMKAILVICHEANTVNKNDMRRTNAAARKTNLNLSDFIKDEEMQIRFK
jgi:glycosyltransferase involved in cell wall biosynthesis